MSALLAEKPFAPRDDGALLREMNDLSRHHLERCPEFGAIWRGWAAAATPAELPFLHVGLFKRILLKSSGADYARVLTSSGTTGSEPSRIALDERSSELQTRSARAILEEFVGADRVPLLLLDHVSTVRKRGTVAARTAAAMSLLPLSSDVRFAFARPDDPTSVNWNEVRSLARTGRLRVYGATHLLWQAWRAGAPADQVAAELAACRIDFIHSGGWKKLEAEKVSREEFDALLLRGLAAGSSVTDFYGLVEQIGVIFPLCAGSSRHVPRWADMLIRDPHSLEPQEREVGLVQLMNPLSWGAPCQSVLTEDLGRLLPGDCSCGRAGKRFELLGRVPKSETRGCANV